MNYLKKLAERRAEAQSKMEEMLNKAETEERALTTDEQTQFEELENQIKAVTSTIEKIKTGRELTQTEEEDKQDKNDEMRTEEQRALENAKIEKEEVRSFADYIRNVIINERSEANLTMGSNGAIVPVTIAKKVITKVYDMSPILEKATKYNTKGKLEIPVYGADNGVDIQMAYANEFTDLESKIGKFTAVELTGFLAGALSKLSNSLINNTDIDIVNKVIEIMADTILRFMEKEGLAGTENKVEGCSGVDLEVIASSATVISADELIKLKNKIKKVFRKDSIWVMSNDTLTAIEMLKDDNGRYLFTEDLTGEYDGKILGYPAYVSDSMPEIGSAKTAILFGDFSGLALKQTQELEIQVLREKFATQHATGIVAWTEFDMKVEHKQKIAKLTMATA